MAQDQSDQDLPPGIEKSVATDSRIRLGLAVLGIVVLLVLLIYLVSPV